VNFSVDGRRTFDNLTYERISLLKFPKKTFSTAWGPAGGRGRAERNLCSAKPFLHPETGVPWKPQAVNNNQLPLLPELVGYGRESMPKGAT
jgi:hypothetical protein